MSCELLVVGSGKLGREIGAFFLRRGTRVCFRSRDPGRLAALQRYLGRALRHDPGPFGGEAAPCFCGPSEPLPDVDFVIESIEESLPAKRAIFAELAERYPPAVALLTNSSSLLPSALHPRCQGLHFFQPLERSGFVEWVRPDGASADVSARIGRLLAQARLHPIVQREAAAFAVNRLFLPVQAACFRALQAGAPPSAVDEASCSPLLPVGQLTLIDAIGIDVVAAAVESYRGRMTATLSEELAPLGDGLLLLLELGKRGRKNGDGLLLGRPTPWPVRPDALSAQLSAQLHAAFVDSCAALAARDELSEAELRVALAGLFGAQRGAGSG